MAKRKSKGTNAGHQRQLKNALKNSGMSDEEILKALPKLKKLIALDLTPPSEIIQNFIEEMKKEKERTAPPSSGGGPDDPLPSAFKEALDLSQFMASATREEMTSVYHRLYFLKEQAKRTRGMDSPIMKQLEKAIAPVEKELKKRESFGAFVKEKAMDFKKTIPERLARKIPVVGGLLGEFLQGKRESREELSRLERKADIETKLPSNKLEKMESMLGIGGTIGEDLSTSTRSPMEAIGGTSAASIPGLVTSIGGGSGDVLTGIFGEVRKIRELLEDHFDPSTDDLKAREAELEAKKGALGRRAAGGSAAGEPGRRQKGGMSGMLSDLMDGGFRRTKIGRGLRKMRVFGKRSMRKLRGLGRMVSRSRLFRKGGMGSRLMGGAKKMMGSAGGGLKKLASSGLSSAGKLASGATSAVSGAAKAGGGMLSGLWSGAKGLVSGLGDKLGSLKGALGGISGIGKVVIGAVGPLLETFFAAKDISAIKNDPNLTPEAKKKAIGLRIGKAIGSVVGQVGLSAALGPAGSAIGALLETLGIGGGALGEWLTEQLGAEKVYDLATAIPGIGNLFKIPEDQEGAEGEAKSTIETPGGTATVAGAISAPSTPNTTVGAMMGAHNSEMNALNNAMSESAAAPAAGGTNATVNTKVSNTVNNFNDDLRMRNNEPTVQQAQRMSLAMW